MAMIGQARRSMRGQPVVVLGVLLMGWVTLRLITWENPFPVSDVLAEAAPSGQAGSTASAMPEEFRLQLPIVPGATGEPALLPSRPTSELPPVRHRQQLRLNDRQGSDPVAGFSQYGPAPARMIAGHTLLLAAGVSQMEVPSHLVRYMTPAVPPVAATRGAPFVVLPRATEPRANPHRWSADGWLLWRDDTTTPLLSGRPSYGRSQAGAVVRFELAPASRRRPQLYLRGSTAIEGPREVEAAVGVSARPLARLPVRVAAEMRLGNRTGGTEFRPAVYAVSELPPLSLPVGLRAESYVQAGYVGGDLSTPFVDGQVRIDRSIAATQDFDLRAGAGAWGGAQEDAARLDIGPSASVGFNLGEARGKLAADYRFRVAGDAEPSSGPALTLSAGF